MEQALLYLLEDLLKWNKEVFGNLFRQKRKAWARMEGIQRKLAKGGGNHLLRMEAKIWEELNTILNQTETFWFQKSRIDAIREGDPNTRCFHLSTITRRKRNKIESLRSTDDEWISDIAEVKNLVLEYSTSLFMDFSYSVMHSNLPSGCFSSSARTTFFPCCTFFISRY